MNFDIDKNEIDKFVDLEDIEAKINEIKKILEVIEEVIKDGNTVTISDTKKGIVTKKIVPTADNLFGDTPIDEYKKNADALIEILTRKR
jgi:bifunctional ADP-heptose synthase (sugar kinase/adenylyltransferase)